MSVPRKTYPIVNKYHSIVDGDERNPVMYRIEIKEGEDCLKDANGKWAFPSKFEEEIFKHGEEVH